MALYVDRSFAARDDSIGPELLDCVPERIEWMRPHDLFADSFWQKAHAHLFNTIEPTDIKQGNLGDCWLLSSLAALAEFPEVVQYCFVDDDVNPSGKYTLRLFDTSRGARGRWMEVVVDDLIPAIRGSSSRKEPCFAKSVDNEFWVCLLEKAFAKYCGGYNQLSGGFPALALTALTSCKSLIYYFVPDSDQILECTPGETNLRNFSAGGSLSLEATGSSFDHDGFWKQLLWFDYRHCLMVITSSGVDEFSESGGSGPEGTGLVDGHAYSLRDVKEVDGFRLVNIRNPWGHFEWGGDWSDHSDMWDKYPHVKEAINPELSDEDAEFWMSFEDMIRCFQTVTVCFLDKEKMRSAKHMRTADKSTHEGGWTLQPSAKVAKRMNQTASEQARNVKASRKLRILNPVEQQIDRLFAGTAAFQAAVKEIFESADKNKNGTIEAEELGDAVKLLIGHDEVMKIGLMFNLPLVMPSKAEFRKIFKMCDVNKSDGVLDFDEFELFIVKAIMVVSRKTWFGNAKKFGIPAAVGGVAGLPLAGLVPGGPVAAMALGSAAGFAGRVVAEVIKPKKEKDATDEKGV
jgi:hypothetical protein